MMTREERIQARLNIEREQQEQKNQRMRDRIPRASKRYKMAEEIREAARLAALRSGRRHPDEAYTLLPEIDYAEIAQKHREQTSTRNQQCTRKVTEFLPSKKIPIFSLEVIVAMCNGLSGLDQIVILSLVNDALKPWVEVSALRAFVGGRIDVEKTVTSLHTLGYLKSFEVNDTTMYGITTTGRTILENLRRAIADPYATHNQTTPAP